MRLPLTYPAALDVSNPLANHPLNVERVGWWLAAAGGHPSFYGGNKFWDLTQFKNHGTLTNSPTWQGALGRRGGWGSLNYTAGAARNSYVLLPTAATPANNTDATLAAWFNHTQTNFRTMLSFTQAGGGEGIALGIHDGKVYFSTTGAFVESTGTTYNDGLWHHAVLTYDSVAQIMSGYVDGVSAITPTSSTSMAPNGQQGGIGSDANTTISNFGGAIDDAAVISRVWSSSEAAAYYQQSQQGYPDVLRWLSTKTYSIPAAPAGSILVEDDGLLYLSVTIW